jgi:hypothetical protein
MVLGVLLNGKLHTRTFRIWSSFEIHPTRRSLKLSMKLSSCGVQAQCRKMMELCERDRQARPSSSSGLKIGLPYSHANFLCCWLMKDEHSQTNWTLKTHRNLK